MELNSKDYWDHRFDTDWEEYGGSKQTRFFAKVALKMMPEWLIREIRLNQYKICDMGCALGDAVDELSKQLEDENICGLDFSEEAIKIAQKRYPEYSFYVGDLNKGIEDTSVDVVFCSNVLEHMEKPKKILENFSGIAKKYIIILIPFKEEYKIEEHITKFYENNIPVNIGDFHLIYTDSVDASKIPDSYYPDQQILLVYSCDKNNISLTKLEDTVKGSNKSFLKKYVSKEENEILKTEKAAAERLLQERTEQFDSVKTCLEEVNEGLKLELDDIKISRDTILQKNEELSGQLNTITGCYQEEQKNREEIQAEHERLLEIKNSLEEQVNALKEELDQMLPLKEENISLKDSLDNALFVTEQKDLIIQRALQQCDKMLGAKLFKVTHLMNRTLNQGIRGSKEERKLFRKWVFTHHKTGGDRDRRYNPLWPLIDILKSPIPDNILGSSITQIYKAEDELSKHLMAEKARFDNDAMQPDNNEVEQLKEIIKNRTYKGILIYPHTVYWEPLQTPQQLLRAFAKEGWLCLFCEHPNIKDCFREVEENVIITHESEVLKAIQSEQVLFMMTWAGSMAFAERFKNKTIWYHILDKLDIFPYYGDVYEKIHRKLLKESEYVSYVSKSLLDCIYNREDAIYLPNGSNPEEFLNQHENFIPEDLKGILAKNHKIIGYYGYIAEWMNYQMIYEMAMERPEYEFVFIGKVIADASLIEGLPNVHFLGLKKYTELSDYAKFFDVATIPFVINEMMHCVSPIKFYEYCALGLPVVTSTMREIEPFVCEYVACAENKDEFLFYLDRFVSNEVQETAKKKAPYLALQNTWQARAAKMESYFEKDKMAILSREYTKYDVIILGVIDYDFRYQRPQHFADRYAANGHRVFYVNANHFNPDSVTQLKENLYIVNIFNSKYNAIHLTDWAEQQEELKQHLRKLMDTYCIRDAVTIVDYPNWFLAAKYLKEMYGFKVITDYMDDYTGFLNPAEKLVGENCKKLLKYSDEIIPSSQFLYDIAKEYNPDISIVRNGTEFEHFHQAYGRKIKNEKPIIGYYGAIAEWFDLKKVCYLAEKMPQCDIVLIGHVSAGEKQLKKYANIKLLGEKPYQELPEYLKEFDVCLIPFDTSTDLIKATNPVKFYEYLSAGKKVVSTEIPELAPFKDQYVYMANDNEKFLEYVQICLDGKDTLASEQQCISFAKENDWQKRYEIFAELVEKSVPQIDIVVLTYNNLKLNKLCINSILQKTAYPNYRLIVVDNLSTDGTREYLKQLQDQKIENVTVILNETNLGFAGGNNVGIQNSDGEYIVLLNNDTVVTRGWLTAMSKHLENNPKLGMTGPVTNSIGNEAKIKVEYTNSKELDLFAYSYTTEHLSEQYPKEPNALALFCTMIKREVIQKCGLLDESYGVGMFEDDDYSEAVKKEGYSLAIVEDAFIHHFEGASFKKLEDEKFKAVFEHNKHVFEEKWNKKWIMHQKREGINWDTNSEVNIL